MESNLLLILYHELSSKVMLLQQDLCIVWELGEKDV